MKKVTALKSNDKKEIFAVILNDEGVKMEFDKSIFDKSILYHEVSGYFIDEREFKDMLTIFFSEGFLLASTKNKRMPSNVFNKLYEKIVTI